MQKSLASSCSRLRVARPLWQVKAGCSEGFIAQNSKFRTNKSRRLHLPYNIASSISRVKFAFEGDPHGTASCARLEPPREIVTGQRNNSDVVALAHFQRHSPAMRIALAVSHDALRRLDQQRTNIRSSIVRQRAVAYDIH